MKPDLGDVWLWEEREGDRSLIMLPTPPRPVDVLVGGMDMVFDYRLVSGSDIGEAATTSRVPEGDARLK